MNHKNEHPVIDHVEFPGSSDNPQAGEQNWTDEEEKLLRRKIDLRLFPMLCVIFGLSLLDRTNISSAYIAGMAESLRLDVGSRYSTTLLVFFIGYCLFELPSNAIIRRLGARYWLSFLIVSWGLVVLGMGFVRDWKVLVVLRAFLGMFEAGVFPGAVFIIGSWYRQYETAKRVSLFYMASMLATGFGPIFAYALSLVRVGDGIFRQGWRWIFIIEGILTVTVGVISPLFLIDFPEKARFLDEREKQIARSRVDFERQVAEIKHLTPREVLSLLNNWRLLLFATQYFIASSSVYSLAFFQPIILRQGLGFDYVKAQLLQSPPYLFAIVASLFMAWLSDRFRIRWAVLIFQALTAITGLLIILYASAAGLRYFGLFLATFGAQSNIPATLAYGQNQTSRQEVKGVTAAAMISMGALGGICGSLIFRSQDAPEYVPGLWTTVGLQILYCIITAILSIYFKRKNDQADKDQRIKLEGTDGFRYAP